MSRRDTIIIAVLVNAALLVILFVAAITTKEETMQETKLVNNALIEETTIDAKELFSNVEKDNTIASKELVSTEAQDEFISLMEETKAQAPKVEAKIIHKLPKLAKVEKQVEKFVEIKMDVFELTVKKGDSLDKIARLNHVKISDITKLNNLNSSFLRIGQRLLIPKNLKNENLSKNIAAKKVKKSYGYYIVKVGDNPYTIAIKHHIKPSQLLKLNNLNEKRARRLKPGDKLRIR